MNIAIAVPTVEPGMPVQPATPRPVTGDTRQTADRGFKDEMSAAASRVSDEQRDTASSDSPQPTQAKVSGEVRNTGQGREESGQQPAEASAPDARKPVASEGDSPIVAVPWVAPENRPAMIRIEPGVGAFIVRAASGGEESTGEVSGKMPGSQRSPSIVLIKPETVPGSQTPGTKGETGLRLAVGRPEWAQMAGAGNTSTRNPVPVAAEAAVAAQSTDKGRPALPEGLAWLQSVSDALREAAGTPIGARGDAVRPVMDPAPVQKDAAQAALLQAQPGKVIDIPDVKMVPAFTEPSKPDSANTLLAPPLPVATTEEFMDMGFTADSGTSDSGSDAFQAYAGVQSLDGGRSANGPSAAHVRPTESAAIVEQIREPLVQAIQKGADHIQLRLKPEGMGEIHIDIRMKDGVSLRIVTGTETAKQVLQAGLADLRNHLESRGIQLGEANVNHREDQQGSPHRHGQDQESGRRQKPHPDNPFSEYLG